MTDSPYKPRKFLFTDQLGWSYSRNATFLDCRRKYYFEYYSKYDIPNVLRISVLKNLTNIPLEIGNISHKVIKKLLERLQKTADPLDEERFYSYAHKEGLNIFRTKQFEEIYYREKTAIDYDGEIFPKVRAALENFVASDRLGWILEEALAYKDEWIIEPEGYGECRIDNQKAYYKVDFLFPIEDTIHVLDWKTGKAHFEKHMTQLVGYATWVHFHFGKELDQIKTAVAYLLPDYREHIPDISDVDFAMLADRIRKETDAMYEYCAEPELNIPLPKEEFPMTENTGFCSYCKYRELCDRA